MRDSFKHGASSADNSFSSFGSMKSDEALIIMNPCEYTIQDGEIDQIPAGISKEPLQARNIEDENEAITIISKNLNMGFRDHAQSKRIKVLKKKGLYVSNSIKASQ